MLLLTSTALDMENVTAMEPVLATVASEMLIVLAKFVKVLQKLALDVDLANVMDLASANLDSPTLTHVFQSVIAPPLAQLLLLENNALVMEPADVVPACVILNGLLFLIAHAKMAVTNLVDLTKFVTAKENVNVFLDTMEKTVMSKLTAIPRLIVSLVHKPKIVLGARNKAFVKAFLNLNSVLMMNS